MRWYIVESKEDGDWYIHPNGLWKRYKAEGSMIDLDGFPYVVDKKRFRDVHGFRPFPWLWTKKFDAGLWREGEPEQIDFLEPKMRTDDITGDVFAHASKSDKVKKVLHPGQDLKLLVIILMAVALIAAIAVIYSQVKK